jgi:hypothetical protein
MFSPKCQELHPVDHLLVCHDHFASGLVFYYFAEDVVCIQMDAHHDVPIALLQRNWECAGLICVWMVFNSSYTMTKML